MNAKPQREGVLIEKVFGTKMKISTQFRNGNSNERDTTELLFTLKYPTVQPGETMEMIPFTDILYRSICSKVQSKSWDPLSETYQPMVQQKTPISLPDVLALNCALGREEECQFWKIQRELLQQATSKKIKEESPKEEKQEKAAVQNQESTKKKETCDAWNIFVEQEGLDLSFDQQNKVTWVPLSVIMRLDKNGEFEVVLNDPKSPKRSVSDTDIQEEIIYDLYASVCHIIDPRTGGNLVAHINVSEKYHQVCIFHIYHL